MVGETTRRSRRRVVAQGLTVPVASRKAKPKPEPKAEPAKTPSDTVTEEIEDDELTEEDEGEEL